MASRRVAISPANNPTLARFREALDGLVGAQTVASRRKS
jgi:hypothetical protein